MDCVNINSEIKDGDSTQLESKAPSISNVQHQIPDVVVKKRRRRGKSKRKILKPFIKFSWQERRKYDKSKRNNRFRKIGLVKTHAPYNNNQFLMEIHKPEPDNDFQILRTPSARTRDSSFSVESEDNYFFSLPENEEEYLTKEFSSVYEDAQSERLSNMSKDDLIQEYLLLEAKYDNLVKRSERLKNKPEEKDLNVVEKEKSAIYKESMITERDMSGTSIESCLTDDHTNDVMKRIKEQEEQIRELQLTNEKLLVENEHLRQRTHESSSEDSESDSSSTSVSDSSSSRASSPMIEQSESNVESNVNNEPYLNGHREDTDEVEHRNNILNGFSSPNGQV